MADPLSHPENDPPRWEMAGTEMDPVTIESWRAYLESFERDVLPMFIAHGYSADAALTAWLSNRVTNELVGVNNRLEMLVRFHRGLARHSKLDPDRIVELGGPGPAEPWRG